MKLLLALLDLIAGRLPKSDSERVADRLWPDRPAQLQISEPTRIPVESLLDAYWNAKTPEVETQAFEDLRREYPDGPWGETSPAGVSDPPTPAPAGPTTDTPPRDLDDSDLLYTAAGALVVYADKHDHIPDLIVELRDRAAQFAAIERRHQPQK